MQTRIDIQFTADADRKTAEQIRQWAAEILTRLAGEPRPSRLSIRIFHRIDELQAFFEQEKSVLAVVSDGELDFIATHEAWRGYPRIHVCSERTKHLSEIVVQGAMQHEVAHAILHGTAEFYTFRFSSHLIAAGETLGLDTQLLQQLVYLLSIALKDSEVVRKLAAAGFESGQIALLEHMLADTETDRRVWEAIHTLSPQRKIVVAAFMKVLLPIQTLLEVGSKAGQRLQRLWENNYSFIAAEQCRQMIDFAVQTLDSRSRPFQTWLEQTALKLITDQKL
jgi:hypothetical protein